MADHLVDDLIVSYGLAERASGAAAWSGSHEEYAEAADRAAEALTKVLEALHATK